MKYKSTFSLIYKQWLSCKESACIAGDVVSSPGLGRFPGGGNGKPLQNSCLGNPTENLGGLQSMGIAKGSDMTL